MPNGTYGGVRGVMLKHPPTRFFCLTCVTGSTAFFPCGCYYSVKVLWKIILLQVIMKSLFR